MSKVLREVNTAAPRDVRDSRENSKPPHRISPSIKDDVLSQADTNPDAMEFDHTMPTGPQAPLSAKTERQDSEPSTQRRPGITTINGGSVSGSTPVTASPPPPALVPRLDSPAATSSASVTGAPPAAPDVDMTALELCAAFERQLLELDDLAAFMGGGV
jgi:hypothetical protein